MTPNNAIAVGLIFLLCLPHAHGQLAPACAGVRNGQFVRNSESCSSYYYCINEIAVAARCPAQFYFNPISQICDHTFRVDCTQCSPTGIQNIEDPNDCRWYYRCVTGLRTHRSCSTGLVFDPRIGDCNAEGMATCNTDNNMCAQFAHMQFYQFGDPYDCTRYYTCLNGITFRQNCAPNLYYNAHIGYCDRPGTFNFCQDLGPIITPGNNPVITLPPTHVTQPPLVWSQPPAWNQPPTVMTTRPPVVTQPPYVTQPVVPRPPVQLPPAIGVKPPLWAGENLCTEPNGNFAIPESCTSYVKCQNGQPLYPVITCREGTFFNLKYQECIWTGTPDCLTDEFMHSDCKEANGYFGVAGWCGQYVLCEDGKIKSYFDCTANTYWNQALGGCSMTKPYYC